MIERPEPVDPEETLGALPDISEVKNFSNGILSQAPIYQPPLPTVPSLVTGFLGPNYGSAIPTEPTAVAGPLGVLAVGNCDVMTAHKDGTSPVHTTTNTFFGNTGDAGSDGDIIAYYDNQYGRFVTIAFATDASTYSHMVVAISKTNDATGAWWKYQFDWTIDGTTPTGNFADFEKVGVSADKFVISSQQFVMSSTAANRVYMYQKFASSIARQCTAAEPQRLSILSIIPDSSL